MCVYIFAGRFQPFHNGHMQVLHELCEITTQRDSVVLAVVAPFTSSDIKDVNFVKSSQEHHLPERNPWSVSVCLSAVSRVAKMFHRDNIMTTLLPRPEYGWDTILNWFPGKRVWIIPEAGEEFDDNKAKYFDSLGDTVIRLPDTTGISGRLLRDYYKHNQFAEFSASVPRCVSEIYFRENESRGSEEDFQFRAKTYELHSRFVTDETCNSIPVRFFTKHKHKVGHLLDAGAGTGYLSWFVNQKMSVKTTTLVDISHNMLQEAQKKKGYTIITHNTSIETFGNLSSKRFDTILVRQLLHYVIDVDYCLDQIRKLLRDDGMVYVGQIVLKDRESQKWHDELMKEISVNRRRSFVYSDLKDLLESHGFVVEDSVVEDYEDNFSDLVNRRLENYHPSTIAELTSKMSYFATPTIKEAVKLKTDERGPCFTVQFCHLLLKKI